MKKPLRTFRLLLMVIMLLQMNFIHAQQILNQVLIASGGAFSDPSDFVTLSSLDPVAGIQSDFDTIYTQAVQKMHVHEGRLYVTATDSLVVYDLESMQRISSAAVSGPNFMQVIGNKLYLTIQYPETSGFLRIFDAETMTPENTLDQISGETAGMVLLNDLLYVAVPGDYLTTTGSLAVIDPFTGNFIEEVNFGETGAGIYSLFAFNNQIVAVCKSAWGTNTGNIVMFNPADHSFGTYNFEHAFGKGIAVDDHMLYLLIDNGIGSIDLNTMQVVDDHIVGDPGSASFIYFADVAFDATGQTFYATVSDYFSFGQGYIYSINGEESGEFTAGISPEAIAFDYRTPAYIPAIEARKLMAYPNPAKQFITIEAPDNEGQSEISLIDTQGRMLLRQPFQKTLTWQLHSIRSGVYQLRLVADNGMIKTQRIIVTH